VVDGIASFAESGRGDLADERHARRARAFADSGVVWFWSASDLRYGPQLCRRDSAIYRSWAGRQAALALQRRSSRTGATPCGSLQPQSLVKRHLPRFSVNRGSGMAGLADETVVVCGGRRAGLFRAALPSAGSKTRSIDVSGSFSCREDHDAGPFRPAECTWVGPARHQSSSSPRRASATG